MQISALERKLHIAIEKKNRCKKEAGAQRRENARLRESLTRVQTELLHAHEELMVRGRRENGHNE
jgi:hypothetical protein